MDGFNYEINSNGGVYRPGARYSDEKKLSVVLKFFELLDDGEEVTVRLLARAAGVGKTYAATIIEEINDGTISFGVTNNNTNRPRGIGSKTLSPADELVLLSVYYDNPKALLSTYQGTLLSHGTFVSTSTLSAWFRNAFPHKMTFCKTNKVPIDKFKPENALRIHEYLLTMSLLLHMIHKIKFGDEKPLKGAELFNGKARKDPFTGVVPGTVVDSDFRNTYNIIGFCGIDVRAPAVDYYIINSQEQTTTAAVFMAAVEASLAKGFLLPGDVLVLDNAAIHLYRESQGLNDLLAQHGVTLLCLPTRVPELNPIELVWNTLTQRLHAMVLSNAGGRDRIVEATNVILSSISHEEIAKYYAHCGYMIK